MTRGKGMRGWIAGFAALMASGLAFSAPAHAQQDEPDEIYVCEQESGNGYTFRYVLHYYYGGYLTIYTRDRYDTDEVGEMELIASDFERGQLFELDERFWVYVNYDKAMVGTGRGSWFCEVVHDDAN